MLSLHKFKLLSFLSSVVLFQQSSSMCLKRAVRPIFNNVRSSVSKTRKFTNLARLQFVLQKNRSNIAKSYSTYIEEPTALEPISSEEALTMICDTKAFRDLLAVYKKAKKNESINAFCRTYCITTLHGLRKETAFYFCTVCDSTADKICKFLYKVAELAGSSIEAGDNEFANILINWALDINEIKTAQEYIKDNKIENLKTLVRDALFRDMYQYYYDYLRYKNVFENNIDTQGWKNALKKERGIVVSEVAKYKDFWFVKYN